MIKKNILEALNKQIQHEQNNAQIYHAVALYFESLNLHGLAAWLTKQAAGERDHAERFIRHVVDRGGTVELGALPAPKSAFADPLEAVKAVLTLETVTTALIYKLADLARKEGDYALEVALHWFITEQIEEEQSANELVTLTGQFYKNPGQLFMLDHQWRKRAKAE
jgi:ferritin